MLNIAKRSEALLEKLDETLTTKGMDIKLLQERSKLTSSLIRALQAADAAKIKRSPPRLA